MATRIRVHTSGNRRASASAWRTPPGSRSARARLHTLPPARRSRACALELGGELGGAGIADLHLVAPYSRVPPHLRSFFPRVDELRFLAVAEIDDGAWLQLALDQVLQRIGAGVHLPAGFEGRLHVENFCR